MLLFPLHLFSKFYQEPWKKALGGEQRYVAFVVNFSITNVIFSSAHISRSHQKQQTSIPEVRESGFEKRKKGTGKDRKGMWHCRCVLFSYAPLLQFSLAHHQTGWLLFLVLFLLPPALFGVSLCPFFY